MKDKKEQLPVGTYLQKGKYKIIRVLGQGGFGITYEVEQTMLNVKFAIKEFFVSTKDVYCLRDTTYSNKVLPKFDEVLYQKLRRDFIHEAQTLYRLDEVANVVKIRDTFEENDTAYIVMDFIEGMSLKQIVEKRGVLLEDKARKYTSDILKSLSQVHTKNILHRDIKPDNIIIRPDNTAVLIDFGIAREFVEDKTQIHTAMLSYGYAPPEQEVANTRKGAYSDLYSVGATIYYCLTGQKPQTLSELNFQDYRSVQFFNKRISSEFNRIIDKAIEKKPKDRFQNCQEFLEQLKCGKVDKDITVTTGNTKSRFKEGNSELDFKMDIVEQNYKAGLLNMALIDLNELLELYPDNEQIKQKINIIRNELDLNKRKQNKSFMLRLLII